MSKEFVDKGKYDELKLFVLLGHDYKESSVKQNGIQTRTYATETNGCFYESFVDGLDYFEFWSDKHPDSLYLYYGPLQKYVVVMAEEVFVVVPDNGEPLPAGKKLGVIESVMSVLELTGQLNTPYHIGLNDGYERRVREEANKAMKAGNYRILRYTYFDDGKGFAYGECLEAPEPFANWQTTEAASERKKDYYWGHYHADKEMALIDYKERTDDYLADNPTVKEVYSYNAVTPLPKGGEPL